MNRIAIFAAKNRDAVYPDPEEGPSKKRVDEKRKKGEGSGRDNVEWKEADATTMPKKMDKVQKQ